MGTRKKPVKKRARKAAGTPDVIGSLPKNGEVKPKWRKHYQRLVALREHLTYQSDNLSRDALDEQPNFSLHIADAGTDSYDRDFALGMLSSEQDAVYEIDQALNRIRNGTYGICELTRKPIEPERLEAIPWTRFSAAAEKQLESEGELRHARLGPRETVASSMKQEKSENEG